ncbi:MAG TPA: hypothetical protein VJR23_05515 [Candidatus Acidoferrales bacterium]|nr:hypothetical protein [Candidatus Acidoferrales bacterium]
MKEKSSGAVRRALVLFLAISFAIPRPAAAADLQPETVAAFNRYAQLTEAGFDSQIARREPFLWYEGLPKDRRESIEAQLRAGQVVIERLETLDQGKPIPVPGGLIHHWIGTVFIPGATLSQTLAFERDYDHQQQYFQPDVKRSKILRHEGNDYSIELMFYKKEVITSVLDTVHEVHYGSVDSTHAWSHSRTTRIQEVENFGEADERLLPEGHDRGFLWRMNTYWRFEEKDGGTYVESQSISLTRDIPTGLGWIAEPFVTKVPRESLTFTLAATRRAILQRIANGK